MQLSDAPVDPLLLFREAPWHVSPLALDDARFPPGCLQPAEAKMLYHLTRDCFRGDGAIVDCGAFLGKSAALLAQGLIDNPRFGPHPRGRLIHSFDWFTVCDDHDVGFIRDVAGVELKIGDSSRALFDRQTASWSHLIRTHEGDFRKAVWADGEIEILFVDVCKSQELNARVLTTMFPSLTPERSIVVQQDYHHLHHPVIHTSMEVLADFIEPLATRVDDSYVFRLRRAVPQNLLAAAADVTRLPAQRQIDLMDAAIARLPPDERHFVGLARAVLIAELRGRSQGMAALGDLPERIAEPDKAKWSSELNAARLRIAGC